jgi:hypothetical protein
MSIDSLFQCAKHGVQWRAIKTKLRATFEKASESFLSGFFQVEAVGLVDGEEELLLHFAFVS